MIENKYCGKEAKDRYRGDDYTYECNEYHQCSTCYELTQKSSVV